MKAERVQFWQRVIDGSRSLVSRIRNVLEWVVAVARAITSLVDSRRNNRNS